MNDQQLRRLLDDTATSMGPTDDTPTRLHRVLRRQHRRRRALATGAVVAVVAAVAVAVATLPAGHTSLRVTATPPTSTPGPVGGAGHSPPAAGPTLLFRSPSGNIHCQLSDADGRVGTSAFCETDTPARSVTMAADGRYTTCTGTRCLGDPGTAESVLAYGAATGLGPFRCASTTAGVSCTVSGRGFAISRAGVTPFPEPTGVPGDAWAQGFFRSPSGNISCEMDGTGHPGGAAVDCQTVTPARSATLGAAGTTTVCTGVGCLGNGPVHDPVLAYGRAATVAPFRCVSAPAGVTCTTADGAGFSIDRAGITRRG